MYSVTKQFHFCAAHRLHNYQGKCANIHGHNYKVEITLESNELEKDMVMDFGEMAQTVGKWIDETMDHTLLICTKDKAFKFLETAIIRPFKCFFMEEKTTAENISRLIHKKCSELLLRREAMVIREVKVWETDSCFATYS